MKFEFMVPTKIVSEKGVSGHTGQYLKALSVNNVLVITDPGVKSAGILKPIYNSLDQHNIRYFEFSDVTQNPRTGECEQAAQRYQQKEIQGIVAVGGGSAIDAAKAISVLIPNGGKTTDFEQQRDFACDPLPLIVVPTTAGTGSEVTFSSVITDTQRQCKMSIKSQKLGPAIALLDSNITKTLPPSIAASTGVDALTHAIEAYTSRCHNPISDALALHAIRLISQHLLDAVNDQENDTARNQMLVASTIAGMAFGNTDVASVHCISESLGGMYDTPHGVGNAIFLPYVFNHNYDADMERHVDVARALGVAGELTGEAAVLAAVDQLHQLNNALGIPSFKQLPHINPDDFLTIAEKSKANGSDKSNAKAMTVDCYLSLLQQAYSA